MKRIHELNEEGLLALTEEQTLKMVDYECALEGVPMLPPDPGPVPSLPELQADTQCYEVSDVLVADPDHAARILSAIMSGPLYKTEYPRNNYELRYLVPLGQGDYNYPKIKPVQYISPELWDKHKEHVTSLSVRKGEWDALKKAYDAAYKERDAIVKDVYERISDARQHAYDREQLRTEFTRYLELAEGNRSIALKFLEKVKDLDKFPELRGEFCPVEVPSVN